jgi:hypothetical protein
MDGSLQLAAVSLSALVVVPSRPSSESRLIIISVWPVSTYSKFEGLTRTVCGCHVSGAVLYRTASHEMAKQQCSKDHSSTISP